MVLPSRCLAIDKKKRTQTYSLMGRYAASFQDGHQKFHNEWVGTLNNDKVILTNTSILLKYKKNKNKNWNAIN
jgi:hypothetical protein